MQKDPLASFIEAENKLAAEQIPAITEVKEEPKAPIIKEEPKAEIKPEAKVETKDEFIDLETPETATETAPAFDFTSFIKDTGIDAKTKEEFVAKYKETISKQSEDPLKGLPDNLRKAVDFAKQGGDFLQMLKINQIDYSQIDPVVLYEQSVKSQIKDQVKAKEYLDSVSPLAKEIEGERLKNQSIQWQQSQEALMLGELQSKATQELVKKAENETRLRETVSKVDNIDGFKVKQGEKDKFIKEVLDGSLTKELFMDEKGNFDYNKMFKARFLIKNFDAIKKHYGSKITTQTKREVIEGLTNAELQTSAERPNSNAENKSTNPLDGWMKMEAEKNRKK